MRSFTSRVKGDCQVDCTSFARDIQPQIRHPALRPQYQRTSGRFFGCESCTCGSCVAILLTGYPDFDSAVEGINGEVDGYLVKPADIEKLLKTIEQKLAARMLRKS
jgi:hypothetical protein